MHTKKQMLDLLLLEPFLAILPEELQAWMHEHHPKNGEEAVALLEDLKVELDEPHQQTLAATFLSAHYDIIRINKVELTQEQELTVDMDSQEKLPGKISGKQCSECETSARASSVTRKSTVERNHVNVTSMERPSAIGQLLLDTSESMVERSPMSVMCVGKLSVTAHIWDTKEPTLEKSPANVIYMEKLSSSAHSSLYISKSTMERSPGDVKHGTTLFICAHSCGTSKKHN
ncbi:hypothetical protein P7K49_007222 [Saguinus oedipus]|uniref:SCAN box domain-containing protein n=1 Tax=Saguinus oedipus TaxID=9490 RepID=A0ABQ9VUY6_SAGOE|nr:hypothetical protein P7K49_007222 [Saguinus oedipus]